MATPMTALAKPRPREVQVYILIDPHTQRISNVVPDPFRVSKGNLQEVRWICVPEQDFSVDFDPNDSPFYESHFDQDSPCSGLPQRKAQALGLQKIYKYTVSTAYDRLDPQGAVDP